MSSFLSFGFSGSRAPSASCAAAVASAAGALVGRGVAASSVLVGCASGVDAVVRAAVPGCVVFSVVGRRSAAALVARSVAFVRGLAASPSPVLLSAPGCACPAGLLPSAVSSRCFCGLGSGSWASLALAVGLGVPVRVWLPAGVVPPASWGVWVASSSGWWVLS